jgi:hypothetical protein
MRVHLRELRELSPVAFVAPDAVRRVEHRVVPRLDELGDDWA